MQKFYLHDATSADTGTLPSTSSALGLTPTVTAPGALTNRVLNGTIGTAQASGVLTTNAVTTLQSGFIRRFLSPPLAAQTIATGTWGFQCGYAESNTNSNFTLFILWGFWRPGTGALVGTSDTINGAIGNGGSTTEVAIANLAIASGRSWTLADGDILVLDVWRQGNAQSMATAYTNTCFYDGITEGSATSNAAFLLAPVDLPLQGATTIFDGQQGSLNDDPFSIQNIGQAVKRGAYFCLGEKWARRRSGLIVPSADRSFAFA